jgi:hypothetical protein
MASGSPKVVIFTPVHLHQGGLATSPLSVSCYIHSNLSGSVDSLLAALPPILGITPGIRITAKYRILGTMAVLSS